ncbi:MAG: hypothetical protein K8963_03965 [Proteobacteria bacterium]|nr:hypothetical protein [Pseudomonadota bacterium]
MTKQRPLTTPVIVCTRVLAIAVALALSVTAPSVRAEEDPSLFNLDLILASKYISEGFVEHDDTVYGVGVEITIPVFPMYIGYSTLRGSDDFHEDEVALGFKFSIADNIIDIGGSYSFGKTLVDIDGAQECLLDMSCTPNNVAKTLFDDSGELYLSMTSAEFYFVRLNASYAHHLVNEGGLIGIGLDLAYDITDIVYFGLGAHAEFDHGYAGIGELSGLYHIDYNLTIGVGLGDIMDLNLSAVYVVPQNDASKHGLTKEIVYLLGFSIGI